MLPDEAPEPGAIAAPGPASVPSQPVPGSPGSGRPVAAGAQPSLRALGVPRPAGSLPTRGRVLRCTTSALRTVHAHLLADRADPRAVAQAVESDPVLALRVLHRANTDHGPSGGVDTVPQALAALGPVALERQVRELAATARPEPMPGLARVLTRALVCQELAGDPTAFTVGMLSGLAAELGMSDDIVVQVAGVSLETADAVRLGSGRLGRVLRGVLAYEASDPGGIARSGLAGVDVYDAYLRCAADAMATAAALGAGGHREH